MKPKLNQFDWIRERLKIKDDERKSFLNKGGKPGRKKTVKPAKDLRFFDANKYDNWLAPARKTETT